MDLLDILRNWIKNKKLRLQCERVDREYEDYLGSIRFRNKILLVYKQYIQFINMDNIGNFYKTEIYASDPEFFEKLEERIKLCKVK